MPLERSYKQLRSACSHPEMLIHPLTVRLQFGTADETGLKRAGLEPSLQHEGAFWKVPGPSMGGVSAPWLSECNRRFSCLSTPSCVYSARHTQVDKYTRCYHTALTAIWMSFNLPRHRRSFSSAQALHSCLSLHSQKLPPLIWKLKAPRVRSCHPAVPADAVWDMGCKDTEPASTPLCGHMWRDNICLWSSFRASNRDRGSTADSPIFETRLLIMQLSLRPYSIKLPKWIARAVRSHFLFFSMNVMLIAYVEREHPYHVKNAEGFTCKCSLAHFKYGPRAVLRPARSTLLLLIGNLVGAD